MSFADMMFDAEDPNPHGQPLKKRKTAAKSRAQSMKVPAVSTASDTDNDAAILELALSTPPDSVTRPKSRALSLSLPSKRKTKTNNPLFKNPVVTKSSAPQAKEVIPTSQPMNKYQGFLTTVDVARSSGNYLSQTTMNKLNAFRFKPSSTQKQPDTLFRDAGRSVEDLNVQDAAASQDSDPDLLGPDTMINGGLPSQMTTYSRHSAIEAYPQVDRGTQNTYMAIEATIGRVSESVPQHRLESVASTDAVPALISHASEPASDDFDFYFPTSSEGRFDDLLMAINVDMIKDPDKLSRTYAYSVNVPETVHVPLEEESRDSSGLREKNASLGTNTEPQDYSTTLRLQEDLAPALLVNDLGTLAAEDNEPDSEFDDGLNDDDFLAVEERITTQAPHQPPSNLQNRATTELTTADQLGLTHTDARNKPTDMLPQNDTGVDEFSMDDVDEDELIKLMELPPKVSETFLPPASVQDAFDEDGEMYDSALQFSPLKPHGGSEAEDFIANVLKFQIEAPLSEGSEESWSYVPRSTNPPGSDDVMLIENPGVVGTVIIPDSSEDHQDRVAAAFKPPSRKVHFIESVDNLSSTPQSTHSSHSIFSDLDDSHEYLPLPPIVRPPFLSLILDRCPVVGLSAQTFLRTCFRIGEMLSQGSKCHALGQDAVIELFARVNFSSREPGTTKQHFQFLDLWHERGPYPNGVLASYKTTGLAESESRVFLGTGGERQGEKRMARVLGKLRRDKKNEAWWLQVINIRETDWEEIKWTKRIVSGDDLVKKVKGTELFDK